MPIRSFAAKTQGSVLENFEYEPQPLGPQDVEVKISHCGICHSDVHLIDNDWKISSYPLVPGHEIVGLVSSLGKDVTHLKINQRVGIGWQRSSCHTCHSCMQSDENLCASQAATCVGHFGGFAEAIRVDSRFAFAVPEKLSSENAAPLLCGGITVFAPLRHYGVEPSMRVGVLGVGGLGHLALQFASKMGCEVTAFSTSPDKEKEARGFGAANYVNLKDAGQIAAVQNSLDFILTTVPVDLDWKQYLNILRPNGKLCFVGASPGPITLDAMQLIVGRKSVCGSPIGGRALINEMFEFAARHNVQAKTEVVAMSSVNEAIQRVRDNKARYRMVLANRG